MNIRIGIIEFILFQLIVYTAVWLSSEYIGFFITLAFPVIIAAILVVSIIAEWIEPSRVPRAFFKFMISAIITPLAVLAFFLILHDGGLPWMEQL